MAKPWDETRKNYAVLVLSAYWFPSFLALERGGCTALGIHQLQRPTIFLDDPPTNTTPLALSPGTTASPTSVASNTDWTTYHRDNLRTGYVADMSDPQKLTRAWNTHLDGAVYAEPLVVGGSVLVVTEGNTLYSLDSHTGQVQWHTNVGSPVPGSQLPCGNIDPLGITGTPVYDPATGLIFAVAEVDPPMCWWASIFTATRSRYVTWLTRRGWSLTRISSMPLLLWLEAWHGLYRLWRALRGLWELSWLGCGFTHGWARTIADLPGTDDT